MATTTKSKGFFLAAAPLFLVLFIDGMGLGLVFPILNALIIDPAGGFLNHATSVDTRNLIFGITIGIFMLCWFFGAAFLGDLSDQIGRKKSLLICLLGSAAGYILSVIAVIFNSYSLLLIGRIVAGFTAGSQPIAQAAIVDISTSENKARNLGFIIFSISLGFIFGPLLGGILSDSNLISWFSFATPFYFAAIISLMNAGLLWLLFHETFFHRGKIKFKLHYAVTIFISAFRHEKVRALSTIFLIFILGWSSYYSFIPMFLSHRYHFTTVEIGLFMGVMGLGFSIGTGFLVNYLTKRFSLRNTVIINTIICAFCVLLTVITFNALVAWISVVFIAATVAVAYATFLTIFSNQVDANSQGWIMGITGAIMAFAFGINGILVGILADFGVSVPLSIAVVCLSLSIILMWIFHTDHTTPLLSEPNS